jgi:hypothetical protein
LAKTSRRQPRQLGTPFVHRQRARQVTASSVWKIRKVQQRLERSILPLSAVHREKYDVGVTGTPEFTNRSG